MSWRFHVEKVVKETTLDTQTRKMAGDIWRELNAALS